MRGGLFLLLIFETSAYFLTGEDGKENYCPILIDSANVLPNFAHSISTQDQSHGAEAYAAVLEEHRQATRIFLHQNKNAGTSLKTKLRFSSFFLSFFIAIVI